MALAAAAARELGAAEDAIRTAAEAFPGAPERLELVREVGGVAYVNDTTATIPEATIAALEALAGRRIILICGGADKGLDYAGLAGAIAGAPGAAIVLGGTASDKLLSHLAAPRTWPPPPGWRTPSSRPAVWPVPATPSSCRRAPPASAASATNSTAASSS